MSRFTSQSTDSSIMGLLSVFKERLLDTLCCVKIGYIDSYDYTTRVSRVIIYNKRVVGLNEKGEHILEDYPPLYCKTLFLGGANCSVNWNIQQGDECIVFFTDKELETPWISGQVSDIKYGRMHNYTDAICLTGFSTLPKTTPTDTNLNITNNNGIININGNTVVNGSLTVNGVLTVTGDAIINGISFTNHVHSGVSTGIYDTGVAKNNEN